MREPDCRFDALKTCALRFTFSSQMGVNDGCAAVTPTDCTFGLQPPRRRAWYVDLSPSGNRTPQPRQADRDDYDVFGPKRERRLVRRWTDGDDADERSTLRRERARPGRRRRREPSA